LAVTTTHLQLVLRLRMSGAVSLLPLYALTLRTETLHLYSNKAHLLNKSSPGLPSPLFNYDLIVLTQAELFNSALEKNTEKSNEVYS
jgi:hypothetical protein